MEKLGWIGLGDMGIPMSKNLMKCKQELTVYNRTASKMRQLEELGALGVMTPQILVEHSDVIFLMLSDDNAVREIFRSIDALEIKKKTFVNMSTVSERLNREIADYCSIKGASFVEAPVSGSTGPAEKGELVILAGGDPLDVEHVLPYLQTMGKEIIHLGPVGYGTRGKLAINYYLSSVLNGLNEVIRFSDKLGIERADMMKIINDGACGSPISKAKTNMICSREFPSAFSLKYLYKDLGLMKNEGLNTDFFNVIYETCGKAIDKGLGDEDAMAILK